MPAGTPFFIEELELTTYDTSMNGGGIPSGGTTVLGDGHHIHKRVVWGALFGGVIIAIAVQLLLSLLGAGIGLGTVNVNAGSTPSGDSLGIGAGLWWVISSCIALFVGGYVSAWMAGISTRFDGILHGLVTWGISTLLTIYLLSSAVGNVIGGGFSALGSVTSAAGSGISSAAKPLAQATGISPDVVQQQAQAYLQPAGTTNAASLTPQQAQTEVASNLVTYEKGGPDAAAAKARIIDVTAAQTKTSREDAAKKFDDAQAKMQQTMDAAKQKAKDAADATASGASKAAFGGFAVLLLGLIAAALGGAFAVQRRALLVTGADTTLRRTA